MIYFSLGGNGESGDTPTPLPTDIIKRISGDSISGSATVKYTSKYDLWIIVDSSYINTYHFKINNEDATNIMTAGVLTHADIVSGIGYTHIEIELNEGDILSWNGDYDNRYFIMFNKVEE